MMLRYGLVRFAALLVPLVIGRAGALDLSLAVQRDVLYQPAEDSSYAPAVVMLGADFRLGGLGHVRARAGYSRYWNWYVSDEDTSQRDISYGYRVQAAPYIRISTPIQSISVSVGLGLGGRWQKDAVSRQPYPWYQHQVINDRVTWAIDQSFVAGFQLDVSRRFAVDIEAERAGMSLAWTALREYHSYPDDPEFLTRRDDIYHVGWVEGAKTGLGMGLRLKL